MSKIGTIIQNLKTYNEEDTEATCLLIDEEDVRTEGEWMGYGLCDEQVSMALEKVFKDFDYHELVKAAINQVISEAKPEDIERV